MLMIRTADCFLRRRSKVEAVDYRRRNRNRSLDSSEGNLTSLETKR